MWRLRAFGGWGAVAAALALTPACEPRRRPPQEPELAAATDTPTPPRRRGELVAQVVARASSPLQLLPDTTVALASVAGIHSLLAVVDLDVVIDRYRAQYDLAAQYLTTTVGHNLLDPGQWREVGIDPDGVFGAALVDARSETLVGFLSLSDSDKFRGFLDRLGGERRLQPMLEDRGLVLKSQPDSNTALVLRDGFAFFITTDKPDQAPYDFARLLATIDPARGLTATPRYQRALASPEPPRPLTAYVDFWALAQAWHEATVWRLQHAEPSWPEQELARAVERGAPPEELTALRQRLDERRDQERQEAEQHAREFALATRWLASIEPVVLEFTASKTGVVGKIRARMPETTPLRGVLRNAPAPSPMFAALAERAVVMLGGSIDPAAALVGLEELVRASGSDPARLRRAFVETTGADLKAEVSPLLAGTGGFALTVSDALLRGDLGDDYKDVGFAVALAVTDVPAAQALVDRLVRKLPAPLSRDARTGAHTLAIAGYRKVFVALAAGELVVTTDVGVISRMIAAKPGPLRGQPAEVVPLLTARDVAAQGLFDVVLPGLLASSRASFESVPLPAPGEPYGMFPDVAPAQLDKIPRSRLYKTRLRAWTALQDKIRKDEQGQARRQVKALLALASCVGVMAANLREQPDGLELTGGQFFGKGGLTEAITLGVDYLAGQRGSDRTWELYGQRSALEEELRKIRIDDLAAALHVPAPAQ